MIDRLCSIEGCNKPLRSSGCAYCNMHYSRLRRGSKDGLAISRQKCLQCGSPLKGKQQTKYCSHQCCVRFLRGTPETRRCLACGDEFATWDHGLYCSDSCKREGLYDWEHRKRAKIRGNATSERFSRLEIFERDSWRCQICGSKTRRDVHGRHPLAPSLDHRTPLSRGGTHTRANCQCAHLRCNFKKHTAVRGQLRLFG
jgi:hypothetical protein